MELFTDTYFMQEALKEARKALQIDEIPIGAVLVMENTIIARGHNQVELLNDATAHAEMLALTSGMESLSSKYLINGTLYVTLEPCMMCAGAIFWSKLTKVVFGAYDDKKGFTKMNNKFLHPKLEIVGGVLRHECLDILQNFFKRKRLENKS